MIMQMWCQATHIKSKTAVHGAIKQIIAAHFTSRLPLRSMLISFYPLQVSIKRSLWGGVRAGDPQIKWHIFSHSPCAFVGSVCMKLLEEEWQNIERTWPMRWFLNASPSSTFQSSTCSSLAWGGSLPRQITQGSNAIELGHKTFAEFDVISQQLQPRSWDPASIIKVASSLLAQQELGIIKPWHCPFFFFCFYFKKSTFLSGFNGVSAFGKQH